MRVGIVNHPQSICPPTGADSISIWSSAVADPLSACCEVVVFSRSTRDLPATEVRDGVNHHRVSLRRDLWMGRLARRLPGRLGETPSVLSPRYFSGFASRVGDALARSACDVGHVHDMWQFLPALRRKAPRTRLVLHMHGDWLAQIPRAHLLPALECADLILGCSDHVTGAIRAAFPEFAESCRTIPNGVDTTVFVPAPSPTTTRTGKRILFVGRLSPEKGVHVLLAAAGALLAEYPDLEVELVGPDAPTPRSFLVDLSDDPEVRALARFYEGSYVEDHLRALVADEHRDRVQFHGLASRDTLPAIYRSADIVVNPSFSESFGMSLIEAFACGVPVVATSVGGMVGIVRADRDGLLVRPGDVSGLAAALRSLLADPDRSREMGRRGREQVLERFSWASVARNLCFEYENLLANGPVVPKKRSRP